MTDLAKTLADLAEKATPGPWAIGTDTRGSEICTMHGVPTMPTEDGIGQEWLYIEYPSIIDGDWHWPTPEAKLTNAELIVTLVNNLPSILAALTAQAEHDKVLAERDGLEAENARLREANGILEDALQEVGDDYPGSSCQEWCIQQIKAARAALEAKL